MTMEQTRSVKGLAQLQKFLDQLPPKLERNVMRGALRAGATVIRNLARTNIHSISGELARSLRVTTFAKQGRVFARVVAGGRKANIQNRPIWVEYGTRAHLISVSESERPVNLRASLRAGRVVRTSMTTLNRNLRRSLRVRGQFVGPVVEHPGARPRPFLRPALDRGATAAVVAAAAYIKRRLTKAGLDAQNVEVG